MKPKAKNEHETGLLEYLEEIIGTNKYVLPIDTAFQELEVLNEERVSKQVRVKNVQKEKDGLEEAKNEAELYLTKEQSIIDKYNIINSQPLNFFRQSILYQIGRMRAEKKAHKCDQKASEVEELLKDHKAIMQKFQDDSEGTRKEFQAVDDEYEVTLFAL
jgi:structural maintenance of chromosome 4